MQKITANDPEALSADIVGHNIDELRALFPDAFTEGKIDFEVLKQLLGGKIEQSDEKYGLSWYGKRAARHLALVPSSGTLRPCPTESLNWDTTQNLMIEGDNLEVLKLLQKSYAGKVKLIYIDPPYNTGRDFIYPDNFRDSLGAYLEITGQVDESGIRLTTNPEASGRFHSAWLDMIYPRLRLARSLLRDDGAIFISIDDSELENLRFVCNEIFGEENFIVQIVWRKRSTPPNDKVIGANHDYIVGFARNIDTVRLNLRERSQEQVERYRNPDNHPKGPWVAGDLMANVKGGRYVQSLYYPIVNPNTGEEHYPSSEGNWRFNADRIAELVARDELYFGADGRGRPKLKRFLADVKDGVTYPSIWDFVPLNTEGSTEMARLLGSMTAFENPKPTGLIEEIVSLGSDRDGIILDFFAGSGTTGHAVMSKNVDDGGHRRFILVQLPEPIEGSTEQIADRTRERLRRAGAELSVSGPPAGVDLGFRSFRLDRSNIEAWDVDRGDLDGSLLNAIDHLRDGRTEQDILYELLLKFGLELTVAIESREVAGMTLHSVGAGTLIACLAESFDLSDVEAVSLAIVGWHEELSPAGGTIVVFRDGAFANDVAKTNATAILEQHGITTVRSL